jgi:hypothetical protein
MLKKVRQLFKTLGAFGTLPAHLLAGVTNLMCFIHHIVNVNLAPVHNRDAHYSARREPPRPEYLHAECRGL